MASYLAEPTALLLIVAAVALPRIAFALLAPSFNGDAQTYALVAQNILQHGCVSMSAPATGACVPHWGGNQLPGFPAFIAATWLLTGGWDLAPLLAQALVFAAASAYLVRQIALGGASARALLLVVLVLALSPTLVAWPRLLLTEALAAAASVWAMAAIVRSVREHELQVVEIAGALAVALFLRYSLLVLAIPVVLAAFRLHPAASALRRVALIAALVAAPFAAWTVRNVAVGLKPLPPVGLAATGAPAALGVLRWMGTWVSSQYDLPNSIWPLLVGNYDAIRPPAAMSPTAVPLLEALVGAGPPVPAAIDNAFARLAAEEREARPLRQWIVLPVTRAANLWLSPFPSMGMPGEVTAEVRTLFSHHLRAGQWFDAVRVAAGNAPQVLLKATVAAWRCLIFAGVVLVVVRAVRARPVAPLTWMAVTLAAVLTAAIATTPFVESRYLVPALVWLEVALAMEFAGRGGARESGTLRNAA